MGGRLPKVVESPVKIGYFHSVLWLSLADSDPRLQFFQSAQFLLDLAATSNCLVGHQNGQPSGRVRIPTVSPTRTVPVRVAPRPRYPWNTSGLPSPIPLLDGASTSPAPNLPPGPVLVRERRAFFLRSRVATRDRNGSNAGVAVRHVAGSRWLGRSGNRTRLSLSSGWASGFPDRGRIPLDDSRGVLASFSPLR